MSLVGTRVRVKDNYAGGLDGVIGKTAKVVAFDPNHDPATEGRLYALDIQGSRTKTYYDSWRKEDVSYTYDYTVLVTGEEIEPVVFDVTDSKGQKIEIGDTVAYGPLGGGVNVGKVVDLKEANDRYYKVAVKVELDETTSHIDGGDRRIDGLPSKRYQTYTHTDRMLVIQKGSFNYVQQFGKITLGSL
ncbi:hypothetical protein SEA_BILLNYE_145 [Streptomyces phage BillNye]|uniref:Uncharacterized protein n=2 Tax=Wilnyevirus billnye TaxID=2560486 RepID=A0A2L1IVU0_9CAUD|nr:hypothetical protein FDJ30_gp113 [Streptomyces phage BillNye]AVD99320.1 hypothetical protein SEA_BILLNYE_145 [Streptomyces phage BillNye]QBZ72403.1 hypothetical protein SEA_CIRCINUS_146 [Streptomyces phage Circinus]